MAWSEPLTPMSVDVADAAYETRVWDSANRLCAHVRVIHDARPNAPHTGEFGAMIIDDTSGGVKQKARALILLVRGALDHAVVLGIEDARTEAPQRLADFAAKRFGVTGVSYGSVVRFNRSLTEVRDHVWSTTDVTGKEL